MNVFKRMNHTSINAYAQLKDWVPYLALAVIVVHIGFGIGNWVSDFTDLPYFRVFAVSVAAAYLVPSRVLAKSLQYFLEVNFLHAMLIVGPTFLFCGLMIELSSALPDLSMIVRRQDQLIGAIALVLFVTPSLAVAIGVLLTHFAAAFMFMSGSYTLSWHSLDPATLTMTSAYLIIFFIGVVIANRTRQELLNKIDALKNIGSTLAHELHTPLLTVKSHAESAIRTDAISIPQSTLRALNAILREIEAATTLIQMFVVNISNNSNRPATLFKPSAIISQTRDEYPYKTKLEESSINVEILSESEIKGDEILFKHILFNLIKNALASVRPGVYPLINIVVDQDDRETTVRVIDHGIGIPADALPKIFTPFYSSKKEIGSGIGLAFCKATVEEHFGGTIECKSAPNTYTEFTIKIPLNRSEGN